MVICRIEPADRSQRAADIRREVPARWRAHRRRLGTSGARAEDDDRATRARRRLQVGARPCHTLPRVSRNERSRCARPACCSNFLTPLVPCQRQVASRQAADGPTSSLTGAPPAARTVRDAAHPLRHRARATSSPAPLNPTLLAADPAPARSDHVRTAFRLLQAGYPRLSRAIRAIRELSGSGQAIRHLSGGEPPRHRHQRAALRTRRALLRSRRAHAASRCQLRASRIALLTGYLRAIRRRSASLSSLSDCRFALDSPRARRGAIFGLIAILSLFAVPAARIARACGSRIACRLRGGSR